MKKGFKICPYCGKEIKVKAIKCQYCLKFLEEEKKEKECPYCLNTINIDSKICPFCDEKLGDEDNVEEINIIEPKEKIEDNISIKNAKKSNLHNNGNKKSNKREIIMWISISICTLLGIFLIFYVSKIMREINGVFYPTSESTQKINIIKDFDTGSIKQYNLNNVNNMDKIDIVSDAEQFELNLKCQELYTSKYFWTGMFKSVWDRNEKREHRSIANTYEYEIFYSPIEKSCIFALKEERDNCGLVVGKCTKVNELNDYDFAQVIYYIDIIKSSSKSEADMFLDYCYKKDTPNELFTRCSDPGIDLSKYKNGWFSLIEQTREQFDDEVRRLKGL